MIDFKNESRINKIRHIEYDMMLLNNMFNNTKELNTYMEARLAQW